MAQKAGEVTDNDQLVINIGQKPKISTVKLLKQGSEINQTGN